MLTGCVSVKQRAGCLSYLEDPRGFRSLLAQSVTIDKAIAWSVPAESIFSFSSDPSTVNFAHYFLEQPEGAATSPDEAGLESSTELEIMHFLTKIVYECVTHDKLSIIPIWITIIKAIQCLSTTPCGPLVWQLKLLIAHGLSHGVCNDCHSANPTVSVELANSVYQQVCYVLDSWEKDLTPAVRSYVGNRQLGYEPQLLKRLAIFLNFHDFPAPDTLASFFLQCPSICKDSVIVQQLLDQDLPKSTIRKIIQLITDPEN